MSDFDFSIFPTLTTPRLLLREVTAADAAELFSFLGDAEVQKYDSDPPLRDVAQALSDIQQTRHYFSAKQAIRWGVELKAENRLVGLLGFYFWDRAYYKADLGYTIARPYWRRGIASEALQALLRFGFEHLRLHRVNVDTRMDHLASLRLVEKLGFRHEGVRRECIRSEDGSYQSWGLFGLLEDEYRAAAAPVE